MNSVIPTIYVTPDGYATPWWVYMLAGGIAGRPQESGKQERLQALVSARRASATEKCEKIRVRSERGIARLVRDSCR
jgi:hypothetical protein